MGAPKGVEAESPVVQPAWPAVAEPQAVQASAVASASSDSAPFQAPEPAPSVEEVASAVPEVGVSLESRMAELFAELSAAEIPSSAEMPTEEYAAPEEEHAVPSLEVVDAEAVTDEPRSEEHTSELQSQSNLVCRLLLEKKNTTRSRTDNTEQCIPSSIAARSTPF